MELQGSVINESQCSIGMDINDYEKDSLNSYRTIQSNLTNITPVGHSSKLPGHATVNKHDILKDQYNDIGSEDSVSHVSNSSTLL